MEHDHMIETFATNGSNHSLYIGSLPRRAPCRQNFADAHISHLCSEVIAEESVAVAPQIVRELFKGKCLPQLLSRPLCGRVGGRIEVKHATAVMGQHQNHVRNLETDGGQGEEVDGDQMLSVILQECAPGLRRRLAAGHHVFADAALTDIDAQLEQLTVDSWSTPRGIPPAHLPDQISDSREMTGRPGCPRRTFQVQNRRKPARCQAMTVCGLTMASAERQSRHSRGIQIHNRWSPEVNFGRFAPYLWSTPIWWRRAKFSSRRAARERKIEHRVASSVVREMSIGENYEGEYDSHPLRKFEIFKRHTSLTLDGRTVV